MCQPVLTQIMRNFFTVITFGLLAIFCSKIQTLNKKLKNRQENQIKKKYKYCLELSETLHIEFSFNTMN